MEGLQNIESAEYDSKWRDLKREAVAEAKERIAGIKGFSDMEYEEQVTTLNALLDELAEQNKNRFIASEVARQLALIEENRRHEVNVAAIGIAG